MTLPRLEERAIFFDSVVFIYEHGRVTVVKGGRSSVKRAAGD